MLDPTDMVILFLITKPLFLAAVLLLLFVRGRASRAALEHEQKRLALPARRGASDELTSPTS